MERGHLLRWPTALGLVAVAVLVLPPSVQGQTPTPEPTATATPTATPEPTGTPGTAALEVVSSPDSQGAPGETIDAGSFTVTNGTSVEISMSDIEIEATQPQLFSEATLTVTRGDTSRESSASPPGTATTFTFDPAIVVPPGEVASFSLDLTVSEGRSAGLSVAAASVAPANGTALWIAALLVVGGAAGRFDRRLATGIVLGGILAIALVHVGCGDDEGRFSTQTVTDVAATDSGGDVPVSGLPAELGTVGTF